MIRPRRQEATDDVIDGQGDLLDVLAEVEEESEGDE